MGVEAVNIYGLSEIVGPGVSNEDFEEKGTGSYIWEDHFFPEVVDRDTGEPNLPIFFPGLPLGRQQERTAYEIEFVDPRKVHHQIASSAPWILGTPIQHGQRFITPVDSLESLVFLPVHDALPVPVHRPAYPTVRSH